MTASRRRWVGALGAQGEQGDGWGTLTGSGTREVGGAPTTRRGNIHIPKRDESRMRTAGLDPIPHL
jgi:hypothetical protein